MIEIRQAKSTDLPAFAALAAASGGGNAPGYFERCLAERDAFIAAQDGADAGYAMLNWWPQYALYKRLGIPEIQDVYVAPAARRQGVASALIAHCETLARADGCAHIGISVALHAAFGPAQRLYAKRGYLPDGFGVTYDRAPVAAGEIRPVDDNLCLMLVREF